MTTRFVSWGLAAAVVVGAPSAGSTDPNQAREALVRMTADIENAENALSLHRSDIANMVAQVRYFPIERRLLDADLFFETGDYEKASTLYRDLVDNPGFKDKPGYWHTVFKLGESLFKQHNYIAARKYFRMAANPAAGPDYAMAVARVFEVAVATRDFSGCETYEAAMPGLLSAPEAAYAFGKYLYFRGAKGRAREVLAHVPAGTALYAKAQYFIGVIEAGEGRLDSALQYFDNAARAAADKDVEVHGMAVLARARILHELGRPKEAIVALQGVNVNSSAFVASLFDAAWMELKLGELQKAANALDILLMSNPGGELALKANALRGRILSRLDDSEGAVQAYEEVSRTLGPVTSELDKVSSNADALDAYFRWVMERNKGTFVAENPVSEGTAKWIEGDPDMQTIVEMFADLARDREDVRESFEIVERLLWALRSGGKLEAFPGLKDKFLKLREVAGRFLDAGARVGDITAKELLPALQGEVRNRYEAAVRARQAAMARLRGVPRDYEGYLKREKRASEEYQELEKQLFLVESLLKVQRQEVLAIEEWLREQLAREDRGQITPEREAEIRASVDAVKRVLIALSDEAAGMRQALERERAENRAMAEAISAEDAALGEAVRALEEEALACRAAAEAVGVGLAEVARTGGDLLARSVAGARGVDPVMKNLLDVADRGAAEYEATVVREKERLEAALAEAQKAEMDSRAFARTEGALVLRAVKDRLSDVLLEADLGLVDMAWQREQILSDKLRALAVERSEKLKRIGEAEQLVKTGQKAGGGEGGKP